MGGWSLPSGRRAQERLWFLNLEFAPLYAFAQRVEVRPEPRALLVNLEVGRWGRCPEFRLAQRIIIGFVKALDFATVETLIPDLKPCAEGFGDA